MVGLLETADEREFVVIAPAQRLDIWADFSQDDSGTKRELISLPFESYGGQVSYSLVQIDIGDGLPLGSEIQEKLSAHKLYDKKDAVNRLSPRTFSLSIRARNGLDHKWTYI